MKSKLSYKYQHPCIHIWFHTDFVGTNHMDLKIIDEFKYHLLTNNSGYINETADTVNENEVFQFRGQYRLTTVILEICIKKNYIISSQIKRSFFTFQNEK